jgi:hypothetical protein
MTEPPVYHVSSIGDGALDRFSIRGRKWVVGLVLWRSRTTVSPNDNDSRANPDTVDD